MDDHYREVLDRLLCTLKRLPFGPYKRGRSGGSTTLHAPTTEPDWGTEPGHWYRGHLLHPGDYQLLMHYLGGASKPKARGRPEITVSARVNKFGFYRDQYEQFLNQMRAEKGERGSIKKAIAKCAEKWGCTEDAARKRISGRARKRISGN
jgi:hypothetical protein